jgi:hypothetical protein
LARCPYVQDYGERGGNLRVDHLRPFLCPLDVKENIILCLCLVPKLYCESKLSVPMSKENRCVTHTKPTKLSFLEVVSLS